MPGVSPLWWHSRFDTNKRPGDQCQKRQPHPAGIRAAEADLHSTPSLSHIASHLIGDSKGKTRTHEGQLIPVPSAR